MKGRILSKNSLNSSEYEGGCFDNFSNKVSSMFTTISNKINDFDEAYEQRDSNPKL